MSRSEADVVLASQRVKAEYTEMPGLGLTGAQAARLFGLDRDTTDTVLRALEANGFLQRRRDGRFVLRS